MASLNQAWNIATGALAADQAAISVVAGNIANANTPGYTTEATQRRGAQSQVAQAATAPGSGFAIVATRPRRPRPT